MGLGEIVIIVMLVIIGGVLTHQIVLSRGRLSAKKDRPLPAPPPKENNQECYAEIDHGIHESESKSSREYIYDAVYLDAPPIASQPVSPSPISPSPISPSPISSPVVQPIAQPIVPPVSPPQGTPVLPSIPAQQKVAIFFEVGDYAGNEIELTQDGFIIGRNPQKANLILKSSQVSGTHVRIAATPYDSVVVEDLDSLNGTFYLSPQAQQYISWEEVSGKKC